MIQVFLLKLRRKLKGWRFSVNMQRKKLSSKERMRLYLRNLRLMSLKDWKLRKNVSQLSSRGFVKRISKLQKHLLKRVYKPQLQKKWNLLNKKPLRNLKNKILEIFPQSNLSL